MYCNIYIILIKSIDISRRVVYCTDVLRKKALKNLAQEPSSSSKELTMKKTIAILLVLVIAASGIFAIPADSPEDKKDSSINITTKVEDFSAFGVSLARLDASSFNSIASFQGSVQSSVDNDTVKMLDLNKFVEVGFLSGINNTKSPVKLFISIEPLKSGDNQVDLILNEYTTSIESADKSKFGTLQNHSIKVMEKTAGDAALAPAGEYSTIVTISLKSK